MLWNCQWMTLSTLKFFYVEKILNGAFEISRWKESYALRSGDRDGHGAKKYLWWNWTSVKCCLSNRFTHVPIWGWVSLCIKIVLSKKPLCWRPRSTNLRNVDAWRMIISEHIIGTVTNFSSKKNVTIMKLAIKRPHTVTFVEYSGFLWAEIRISCP